MAKSINRRIALKRIGWVAAASTLPVVLRPTPVFSLTAGPQPTIPTLISAPLPTDSEAAAIANIAQQLMDQYHAPGLSVAIARHGQLVYQQGFGLADKASGERVTTASRFRIASLSKPITSVAIFTLIEQGRLGLDDLVF